MRMAKVVDIPEDELDLLRELFNIGMARAADSLAMTIGKQVLLQVPTLKVMKLYKMSHLVKDLEHYSLVVESDLKGDLQGRFFLLLQAPHVQELSRISRENARVSFEDESRVSISLLQEVTNILMGAVTTQLSNLLNINIFGASPDFPSAQIADRIKRFVLQTPLHQGIIFTIASKFTDPQQRLEFSMVMVFTLESLEKLLGLIRQNRSQCLTYLQAPEN